jgi:DNA repair exonuclease SbcCD ATPase subunit
MKRFSLQRIIISNFRSFLQASIQLNQTPGLKLIAGDNQVDKRLGSNGSGKSSLLRSVEFILYGTPRISSILTWGQKLLEGLVEILINNELHTIYRSGPPMRIELDDHPATQEQIDELLGLTREQFMHSVIFGQGAPLFPDLPIPTRGEILDSILRLEIWEKAAEVASKRVTEYEKKLAHQKSQLSFIEGQLTSLVDEEYITQKIVTWDKQKEERLNQIGLDLRTWEEKRKTEIDSIHQQIDAWQETQKADLEEKANEIESLNRELATAQDVLTELPQLDCKNIEEDVHQTENRLNQVLQENTKLQAERHLSIEKPRAFWLENDVCPTCHSPISPDKKQEHLYCLETRERDLTEAINTTTLQADSLKEELDQKRKALSVIQAQVAQQRLMRNNYSNEIDRLEKEIEKLSQKAQVIIDRVQGGLHPYALQLARITNDTNPYQKQLYNLRHETNPHISELDENKKLRKELGEKKAQQSQEIQQIESAMVSVEYWKHGFKRIRLYFIEQILTALEIEIQSVLSALGLDSWHVKLQTESETKSGSTKLGVQVHIQSPTSEGEWTTWSGGEAQRLRLGIALGLASLIQRMNGCFYNFLILDEPTSWLSQEGIEDLLQALQYRAESLNQSIYVTDHRALQSSSFNEVLLVTKDENGSRIEKVYELLT